MGRVYKPTRKAISPDGAPVVIEYDHFYIEYTDSCGRTRRRKAGLTAGAAKDALRQAESEVLAEKNGLPTRKAGEILLSEMLAAYLQALKQHITPEHASKTEAAIEKVLAETRCAFLKDLKPECVEVFMSALQDAGKVSARTINAPLVALKSMLNWAVKTRRIPYNPLTCLKAMTGEKKRKRRALTEAEIGALLAAGLEGPRRRGMRQRQNRPRKDKSFKPVHMKLHIQAKLASEGRNAAHLYRLMLEAGLRLNEARCLTWADLDLDAKTIHLRLETTKNGNADTLPIAPALLAALQARKRELKPVEGAPVVRISSRVLKAFNSDLTAAGIEKKDAAGRTIDLHALRHTFGTRLMRNGADVKTIQSLMCHATAAMTLGVYVHKDKGQMAAAVESLPTIAPAARHEAAATLKTGTDDRDEMPDDDPDNGGNPLHNRHAEKANSGKAHGASALHDGAICTLNHRVGGSSSPGRIHAAQCNPTQPRATQSDTTGAATNAVFVVYCNPALNSAEKCNLYRQGAAKVFSGGLNSRLDFSRETWRFVGFGRSIPPVSLQAAVAALPELNSTASPKSYRTKPTHRSFGGTGPDASPSRKRCISHQYSIFGSARIRACRARNLGTRVLSVALRVGAHWRCKSVCRW